MKSQNIITYLFSLLGVALLCCCTHNGGDIGPIFGKWHLQEITIDGETDTAYDGNLFWAFQKNIVNMQEGAQELPDQEPDGCWGTFRLTETTLYLDFSHWDDKNHAGASPYIPLAATHLPFGKDLPLQILKLGGGKMQLSYTNPETNTNYGYYFRKY